MRCSGATTGTDTRYDLEQGNHRVQAVQVTAYGGVDGMELRDLPLPEPGAGEVRVRVHCAGVNFTDVYTRLGHCRHSRTCTNQSAFTLGREAAGEVDAVGPGVDGVQSGQRVAWCLAPGTYAEYAPAPAWRTGTGTRCGAARRGHRW